ncbi:MbtH family protein [Loktanella agnita]|uniref:MbtH family protein n=1 Tax=Loktanella agnita TaxID=287097 RepID=UPI0039865DF7
MTTNAQFHVVINDLNEHALWPKHLPVPTGWQHEGFSGSRADCMQHIDKVWSDMTPATLS